MSDARGGFKTPTLLRVTKLTNRRTNPPLRGGIGKARRSVFLFLPHRYKPVVQRRVSDPSRRQVSRPANRTTSDDDTRMNQTNPTIPTLNGHRSRDTFFIFDPRRERATDRHTNTNPRGQRSTTPFRCCCNGAFQLEGGFTPLPPSLRHGGRGRGERPPAPSGTEGPPPATTTTTATACRGAGLPSGEYGRRRDRSGSPRPPTAPPRGSAKRKKFPGRPGWSR